MSAVYLSSRDIYIVNCQIYCKFMLVCNRFLFEGNEGTALYTGDFRLSKEDFLTFDHLKSGTRYEQNKIQHVILEIRYW
jgi:hypothetical protein